MRVLRLLAPLFVLWVAIGAVINGITAVDHHPWFATLPYLIAAFVVALAWIAWIAAGELE